MSSACLLCPLRIPPQAAPRVCNRRPPHLTHLTPPHPTPAPLPQFDFGGALATRLAELVKARLVVPGSLLWRNAVDLLLVRMVDSHPQVRVRGARCALAVEGSGSWALRPG